MDNIDYETAYRMLSQNLKLIGGGKLYVSFKDDEIMDVFLARVEAGMTADELYDFLKNNSGRYMVVPSWATEEEIKKICELYVA